MATTTNLVGLISAFESLSKSPEVFFKAKEDLAKDAIHNVKELFDYSRQSVRKDPVFTGQKLRGSARASTSCPLQELLVDNFDDEQIWQQIELQNEPLMYALKAGVKKFKNVDSLGVRNTSRNGAESTAISNGEDVIEFESDDEDDDVDDNDDRIGKMLPASSSEDDDDDDTNHVDKEVDKEDDNDFDEESKVIDNKKNSNKLVTTKSKNSTNRKPAKRGSIVDDRFFKLAEMNEFLDKMDMEFENARSGKKNHKDDDEEEEDVDYFMDIDSNDDDDKDENDDDDDDWDDAVQASSSAIGRSAKTSMENKSKKVTELKYQDFFDPPSGAMAKNTSKDDAGDDSEDDDEDDEDMENDETVDDHVDDDDGDDSDVDDDDENEGNDDNNTKKDDNDDAKALSRHEKHQKKLQQKIEQLEKENLSKKPWQMSGEAGGKARPINSLLAEDLNFDHTTATAPPITEETTQDLEDIIKQRIKDEAWDDVERKTKPVLQPYEYKKKQPLDQEKSKLSLSQIYEQEYLKQTAEPDSKKEDEENPEHKEIKNMMTKLFTKLDALSNFHFTPKPLKPELKIVTNTPAINMEEVAPVSTSDAMLLAPEETHVKKTELKGDSEKTDTDKKRARRTKKLKQRGKAQDKERKRKLVEKVNPGLGNKYAKIDAMSKLEKESKTSKNLSLVNEDKNERTLKSSTAFFSKLQDEVRQQVKTKKDTKKSKKKSISTSQLKL